MKQFKDLSDYNDMVLLHIQKALTNSFSPYKTMEEYCMKNLHILNGVVEKKELKEKIMKLNSDINVSYLEDMIDTLENIQKNGIELSEFLGAYNQIMHPSSRTETASRTDENIVLSQLHLLLKKKKCSLKNLLPIRYDKNIMVASIVDFDNITELKTLDKRQFYEKYALTPDSRFLNFELLEAELKKKGLSDILDIIFNKVIENFTEITELYSPKDPANTGFVSYDELIAGLEGIGVKSIDFPLLCDHLDLLHQRTCSYKQLGVELEGHTESQSIMSQNPTLMQIHDFIKSNKESHMGKIFKPIVRINFDGNFYITPRDFRDSLIQMGINLTEAQFSEICLELDPSKTGHIDYHTFCKKLGYVSPMDSETTHPSEETKLNEQIPIREFILSLINRIESNNLHLNTIFQPYDKENTGEISQTDFVYAVKKIQLPVPNMTSLLEEFESSIHKGKLDYKKIIHTVEQKGKAISTIYLAFSIMEKEMASKHQEDLYSLLEKWDTNQVKRFSKSDFREILESLCHIQGISEVDLDIIVRHLNPRGIDAVDFCYLEKEYNEYITYRPQTMDIKRKVFQYFKDYCDCFNVELGKALYKYNMIDGVLKKVDFEIACKELCQGKVTEKEIQNVYFQLKNPIGDIYVPFLLTQYNAQFQIETQEKERILVRIARQCLGKNFDLLSNFERLDFSRRSTIPIRDVIKLLTTELQLGEELYSSLAVLLSEYDISKNELVNYRLLCGDIVERSERITMMQLYLSDLRDFLSQKGINFFDILRFEDKNLSGILPLEDVEKCVDSTGFNGNKSTLRNILQEMQKNNSIVYSDFNNKIQIARRLYSASPKLNSKKEEILKSLASIIVKGKYNIKQSFESEDRENKLEVSLATFCEILKTFLLSEFSQKEIEDMGKTYINFSTNLVRYNFFLEELYPTCKSMEPLPEKPKANLDWANSIFQKIAVKFDVENLTGTNYFNNYGCNRINQTCPQDGFVRGLRELKLDFSEGDIIHLAKDLDRNLSGNISILEFETQIESAKHTAISSFNEITHQKIQEIFNAKKINFQMNMNKFDFYNKGIVDSIDFERELRIIMGTQLEELQFKYLFKKYEIQPNKISYKPFLKKLLEQKPPEGDPTQTLIDRLRTEIIKQDLRIASKLKTYRENPRDVSPVFPNTVLWEIFSTNLVTSTELSALLKLLDPDNQGKFSYDSFCTLFWTGEDEEQLRHNQSAFIEKTLTTIRKFINYKKINLEREFKRFDPHNIEYLCCDDYKKFFANLGMPLSPRQLSAILLGKDIRTDMYYRRNYKDVLNIINREKGTDISAQQEEISEYRQKSKPTSVDLDQIFKRIAEDATKKSINLSKIFSDEDFQHNLFISSSKFFDIIGLYSRPLTIEEQTQLCELPKICDKSNIYYLEFLDRLKSYESGKPTLRAVPSSFEENKDINQHFFAEEIELFEDGINYAYDQLNILKDVLEQKKIDIKTEFGKFDKEGFIEFSQFCEVLQNYELNLQHQDQLNVLYSYLKEEEENKISLKRLFDTMLFNQKLSQYKTKSRLQHEELVKAEIAESKLHIAKLSEFMNDQQIPRTYFLKYGRNVSLESLRFALDEMKFECTEYELGLIFKSIDVRENQIGSIPHLLSLLEENSTSAPQKVVLSESSQEMIDQINKELEEKKIDYKQFYEIFDVNKDGYVDKTEFISGMRKMNIKITAENLASLFNALDNTKTETLSINKLGIYIHGVKKSRLDRSKEIGIDEKIQEEITKLFNQLDEDKSGSLSEEELYRAITATSYNKYSREYVREIFRSLDTDNNGCIDRNEFTQFMENRIKNDIMDAEDQMEDLRRQFIEHDLDGNGWLTPMEIYGLLKKKYPSIKIEELEALIEAIDTNRDGKIDIDEFISFMHKTKEDLLSQKDSKQYKAVLAIRAQRRFSPSEFLNYFTKAAVSMLYLPSAISTLHSQYKNLPSDSFKLIRNPSGIGYVGISPVIDSNGKPTQVLKEIEPYLAGYIQMESATGIPIPGDGVIKREDIVNRTVHIGYFNNEIKQFISGTAFFQAEWLPDEEDVWKFNAVGSTGTNPITFKWSNPAQVPKIDVVFEFITSVRKEDNITEVSNGWGKIPLEKLAITGYQTLELRAGSPFNPAPLDKGDVRTERKGIFAALQRTFGSAIKSEFKIYIRNMSNLLASKQRFVKLLPAQCLIHKKLLPFYAFYRIYVSKIVLNELMLQSRPVDQDLILSQFPEIINNQDLVNLLIGHWDAVFQRFRKNEVELLKQFQEFVYRLYCVTKCVAFNGDSSHPYKSAQGSKTLYVTRKKLIDSALIPIYTPNPVGVENIYNQPYKNFRIDELRVKREKASFKPVVVSKVEEKKISK